METKRWRAGFDKPYWCMTNKINVLKKNDCRDKYDDINYETGNYFKTKEEAESMARKIKAVLNGAEVIKMPSESEIKDAQKHIEDDVVFNIRTVDGQQLAYYMAINKGAELMADWFKSKIVK